MSHLSHSEIFAEWINEWKTYRKSSLCKEKSVWVRGWRGWRRGAGGEAERRLWCIQFTCCLFRYLPPEGGGQQVAFIQGETRPGYCSRMIPLQLVSDIVLKGPETRVRKTSLVPFVIVQLGSYEQLKWDRWKENKGRNRFQKIWEEEWPGFDDWIGTVGRRRKSRRNPSGLCVFGWLGNAGIESRLSDRSWVLF